MKQTRKLQDIHATALAQFADVQSALRDERMQCLEDRRFYSIAGAQWEGPLSEQFENKPKFEVNKVMLACMRIFNDYRSQRIAVDFVSKDGESSDDMTELCNSLYRADEIDSVAEEAFDNAFEEAVGGGFGAFRLKTVYENEDDDDDDKQRIRIEPIFDADTSVFFDLNAKRQDKADASHCFVIYSMTRKSYTEEWDDDPATWPKEVQQHQFDWLTPDVVYIAEYYVVEKVKETIHIYQALDGSEERYKDSDFEADETLLSVLNATGSVKIREKKATRKMVHKYIMSGAGILEDCGYLAGKNIPIVPVYGKRWFVDNVERCMGHVRLAKDAQRLKNMQLSKLGEISAQSSVEKPILTPEQVAGHQMMWSEDNIKSYPYLLINSITGPNGESMPAGPVAYTKPSSIPPAMAALLQVTETDMMDILGNQQGAEKVVSNISGKAVEAIQQRLDMQTFIYVSNMAKAVRRCGEIWLSMAKDVYVESGRKMKTVGVQGEIDSKSLMRPTIGEDGEFKLENDLSRADLDVGVDVGPSSRSKRDATVRSLIDMMQVTQDPQTAQVLQSMVMLNMEGEGISEVRGYFRDKLLKMGVLKPTEQEAQEMAEAQSNQPPDPNAEFLKASAAEAEAKAEKARADTIKALADAEHTNAETMRIKAETELLGAQGQPSQVQAIEQPDDYELARKHLELQRMQLDLEAQARAMNREDRADGHVIEKEGNEQAVSASLAAAAQAIAQAVEMMSGKIEKSAEADEAAEKKEDQRRAELLEVLKKPRKIVRRDGKVVGIE
jgi:Phage P22-like portal protein